MSLNILQINASCGRASALRQWVDQGAYEQGQRWKITVILERTPLIGRIIEVFQNYLHPITDDQKQAFEQQRAVVQERVLPGGPKRHLPQLLGQGMILKLGGIA